MTISVLAVTASRTAARRGWTLAATRTAKSSTSTSTIASPTILGDKIVKRLFSEISAKETTLAASSAAAGSRPLIRQSISLQERAALRAARKERAAKVLQQTRQQQGGAGSTVNAATGTATAAGTNTTAASSQGMAMSSNKWVWYMGVAVPTLLLAWGLNDEDSLPAKASRMIGLTSLITSFTDQIAKPSYDKLLPDWSQMPNVPHDIAQLPHTLVLDLENTLVHATWDRKYGWRHVKRPGVDKFLHDMAQYYEIVLYSPSIDSIAEPVVMALDKDGCILHRLYRDATYYHNGVHVKDLKRLNRNVKRMIVLDDDPSEVQFNPENLIRVKPFSDPKDKTDNTLARITPFLLEIARDNHQDIPALLKQYRGMDADQIADEQERRLMQIRQERERLTQRGLSALAGGARGMLPPPELPAAGEYSAYTSSSPGQLTAKDIAGAAPPSAAQEQGLMGWMGRRAKEKEEHQMRKLEKWNEVLLKRQQQQKQREQQS